MSTFLSKRIGRLNFIEFIEVLIEFNRYSALPGIIFSLFFLKNWKDSAGIIFYILLASFSADFVSYLYAKHVTPNSYIIANAWYCVNYLLVVWLYYKILPSKDKRWIYILVVLFLIATPISFFFYSFFDSNTVIRLMSNVSFIIISLLAFFELLKKPETGLKKSPVFWIVSAIFIHSCLTLLRNIFLQYLVFDLNASKEIVSWIWLINLVANISKNFILFYALVLIDKGFSDKIETTKPS